MIVSDVRCVGLGRQILHKTLHGVGFRGGVCRGGFGGLWRVGSAGKRVNYWADFASNVLSLSGFPRLKNLSQKCLFLKSLVFKRLATRAGRTLKKLKRRGRERKREEKRGRKRKKEERSGRDRGRRTKGQFF